MVPLICCFHDKPYFQIIWFAYFVFFSQLSIGVNFPLTVCVLASAFVVNPCIV